MAMALPDDNPPPLDARALAAAFDLVERQVRDGRVRYAALGVARGEDLLRADGWGREGRFSEPVRFLIASITKPITATAVMQLVEDGVLDLSEPIRRYLPEFEPEPPSAGEPGGEAITTWHVLTHTSGLGDLGPDYIDTRRPSPRDVYEWVLRSRLRFAPGSRYEYASDSWYLLAELVRRLGGLTLAEHIRRRILEPLGMAATTFDPAEPGPEPLPLGGYFDRYGSFLPIATRYFVSLGMPAGGLWSTPHDLTRFGRAMMAGGALDGVRVLGRSFVDLMTREHTRDVLDRGDPPQPPRYGLGWRRIGQTAGLPLGPAAVGHDGATGGSLVIDPENDLVVVYLRNEWDGGAAANDEAVRAVFAALR